MYIIIYIILYICSYYLTRYLIKKYTDGSWDYTDVCLTLLISITLICGPLVGLVLLAQGLPKPPKWL